MVCKRFHLPHQWIFELETLFKEDENLMWILNLKNFQKVRNVPLVFKTRVNLPRRQSLGVRGQRPWVREKLTFWQRISLAENSFWPKTKAPSRKTGISAGMAENPTISVVMWPRIPRIRLRTEAVGRNSTLFGRDLLCSADEWPISSLFGREWRFSAMKWPKMEAAGRDWRISAEISAENVDLMKLDWKSYLLAEEQWIFGCVLAEKQNISAVS